jgi:hypothetical protein
LGGAGVWLAGKAPAVVGWGLVNGEIFVAADISNVVRDLPPADNFICLGKDFVLGFCAKIDLIAIAKNYSCVESVDHRPVFNGITVVLYGGFLVIRHFKTPFAFVV